LPRNAYHWEMMPLAHRKPQNAWFLSQIRDFGPCFWRVKPCRMGSRVRTTETWISLEFRLAHHRHNFIKFLPNCRFRPKKGCAKWCAKWHTVRQFGGRGQVWVVHNLCKNTWWGHWTLLPPNKDFASRLRYFAAFRRFSLFAAFADFGGGL
jgi:hypothetical protein